MAYLKPVDGYIVDVPNATFTRCDKRVFYFDQLNSCNFSPTMEPIQINGGQGKYPVAYIDAGAAAEIQLTSSQFRADLFELAHDATAKAVPAARMVKRSGRYEVGDDLKIKLPAGVTKAYISGFEMGETTATTGKFVLKPVAETGSGSEAVPAHTTVEFFAGEVAKEDRLIVTYDASVVGTVIPVMSDGTSAKGELQLEYPVYSSGVDCTDAAKKGALILTVYRVRVSAMPGFDSSYKTAVTNGLTFSVIDPLRGDGVMWDWVYIPA